MSKTILPAIRAGRLAKVPAGSLVMIRSGDIPCFCLTTKLAESGDDPGIVLLSPTTEKTSANVEGEDQGYAVDFGLQWTIFCEPTPENVELYRLPDLLPMGALVFGENGPVMIALRTPTGKQAFYRFTDFKTVRAPEQGSAFARRWSIQVRGPNGPMTVVNVRTF